MGKDIRAAKVATGLYWLVRDWRMDIEALNRVVDWIERAAFDIPPPNSHTPKIVQHCHLLRRIINDEGTRMVPPKLIVEP